MVAGSLRRRPLEGGQGERGEAGQGAAVQVHTPEDGGRTAGPGSGARMWDPCVGLHR